nr:hypothetical transcript [Hymenolepis microstoma]
MSTSSNGDSMFQHSNEPDLNDAFTENPLFTTASKTFQEPNNSCVRNSPEPKATMAIWEEPLANLKKVLTNLCKASVTTPQELVKEEEWEEILRELNGSMLHLNLADDATSTMNSDVGLQRLQRIMKCNISKALSVGA